MTMTEPTRQPSLPPRNVLTSSSNYDNNDRADTATISSSKKRVRGFFPSDPSRSEFGDIDVDDDDNDPDYQQHIEAARGEEAVEEENLLSPPRKKQKVISDINECVQVQEFLAAPTIRKLSKSHLTKGQRTLLAVTYGGNVTFDMSEAQVKCVAIKALISSGKVDGELGEAYELLKVTEIEFTNKARQENENSDVQAEFRSLDSEEFWGRLKVLESEENLLRLQIQADKEKEERDKVWDGQRIYGHVTEFSHWSMTRTEHKSEKTENFPAPEGSLSLEELFQVSEVSPNVSTEEILAEEENPIVGKETLSVQNVPQDSSEITEAKLTDIESSTLEVGQRREEAEREERRRQEEAEQSREEARREERRRQEEAEQRKEEAEREERRQEEAEQRREEAEREERRRQEEAKREERRRQHELALKESEQALKVSELELLDKELELERAKKESAEALAAQQASSSTPSALNTFLSTVNSLVSKWTEDEWEQWLEEIEFLFETYVVGPAERTLLLTKHLDGKAKAPTEHWTGINEETWLPSVRPSPGCMKLLLRGGDNSSECNTFKDVLNRTMLEDLFQCVPGLLAVYHSDKQPATLKEACRLADAWETYNHPEAECHYREHNQRANPSAACQ
ncbi:golgin subfamily A member 6-like protein 26 [Macrobrachium rosenbergii]|uniref:golgin subfamily A member 6-like protein 26 n=1 Tax=Macrobrachium rosenbergii TaxID=79674 RepID=UPI0034D71E87